MIFSTLNVVIRVLVLGVAGSVLHSAIFVILRLPLRFGLVAFFGLSGSLTPTSVSCETRFDSFLNDSSLGVVSDYLSYHMLLCR